MDNMEKYQLISETCEKSNRKQPTKVLIITSEEHQEKLLSNLMTNNAGTVVINLNEANINNKSNSKRSSCQSNNDMHDNSLQMASSKRRRADLMCVVCSGPAYGYNFNQITCESCKAFFRRTAFHPIDKTKCLSQKNSSNQILCSIRYENKNKCQRCRLLKCFESGMRKDLMQSPEEKRLKLQQLEDNRRRNFHIEPIKQGKSNENDVKYEPTTNNSTLTSLSSSSILTEMDWYSLRYIQNAYEIATQSTPSAVSSIKLELAPDKASAYMNTIDIQNFTAVKLINFIRQIPEFELLIENDRVILVKYNLTLLFIIHLALTFDAKREICYDSLVSDSISPAAEEFAQYYKSLFILCYGYEFNRSFTSLLHKVSDIVDKDAIIAELLILVTIFLKGLSADDDQEPVLNNGSQVFRIHSKYTDLLFRYLTERLSFEVAVCKMMQIVGVLIKSQELIRNFHQYLKTKIDINCINPLMKSLLHFT